MKRPFVIAAAVLMLLLALPNPSAACSDTPCLNHGIEMRRDFVVRVTHASKPLAGVSVRVTSYTEEHEEVVRFSGTTATDGSVRVVDLPPGNYWLNTELLEITAGSQCFHVGNRASRKAKRAVTYEWGNSAPATRRIAGKLLDSQAGQGGTPAWNLVHRVDVPIREARLRLQDPLTGAVYSTVSDQDGSFSFDSVPNGIYVLHVEGGSTPNVRDYDSTDRLIELSDAATRNMVVLKWWTGPGGGSCGGTYLELQNTSN